MSDFKTSVSRQIDSENKEYVNCFKWDFEKKRNVIEQEWNQLGLEKIY